MITLIDIKERLRQRLIDYDGNVEPNDLLDIVEDAKEIGIDNTQIARLVPEVDATINWEHIRAEKMKAAELLQQETEKAAARRAEIEAAPEYLDTLISYCLADGIMEASEMRVIFQKAESLEQDKLALAVKIQRLLDKEGFRPHPHEEPDTDGLLGLLMSADWFTENAFSVAQRSRERAEPAEAPAQIIDFSADKPQIKRGGYVTLRWNVSGVNQIVISHLGKTTKLKGEQLVRPKETVTYTLTAGDQRRDVKIVITKPKIARNLLILVIGIIIVVAIVKAAIWYSSRSGNIGVQRATGTTTSGPLTAGSMHASPGVTAAEEKAIAATMNRYLQAQGEDNVSPSALSRVCDFYDYPVSSFFGKKAATRQYVYNNALEYRSKYRQDKWQLSVSDTRLSKLPGSGYEMQLGGLFSYYIRNPKVSSGYKALYVRKRYRLNGDYKIVSVDEEEEKMK